MAVTGSGSVAGGGAGGLMQSMGLREAAGSLDMVKSTIYDFASFPLFPGTPE